MADQRARMKEAPARLPARQRIVAGARRHFFAHGFRGVTTDELASELGMSKKTLYAHFPSKHAIIEAAILDKFHELQAELEQITSGDGSDFGRTLHELLACLLRHTDEIQPPFLRDMRRESPELFQLVESRRTALIQRYFGQLFASGQRARMIRKDIPTGLLVEILLAAIQGVVNPRRLTELGQTPTTAFTAIISVILEGALTSTGRAKR